MFVKKSLLAAATITALMAAPLWAMDIPADAMLGAAPADMTTVTMFEDSAFVGNEVSTKDQIVIGLVDAVFTGANGTPMALISLSSDIASKSSVKSFTVPLPVDGNADGALTLGWNEQELFTALSGNLETSVSE